MRLARIIIRVSNLDRSVEFWTSAVGFEMVGSGGPFAFIDGGGVQLAIHQIDERPDDLSLTELVLEFDDVRSAFDALRERGVAFEVDLRTVTTEGDRELLAAHFRDPDGHLASVTGWFPSRPRRRR